MSVFVYLYLFTHFFSAIKIKSTAFLSNVTKNHLTSNITIMKLDADNYSVNLIRKNFYLKKNC